VAIATSLPFRLVVTVALLALIAVSIDWGQVSDTLAAGSWGWFAGAVAVLIVVLAIGGVRWHYLLLAAGMTVSRFQAIRAFWIAAFTNNFLPTGFGGDAARVLLVARGGPALARTITSVLVDRISSIGCLIIVGLVAMVVVPGDVPSELRALLAAVAGAAVIGAVALGLLLRARRLGRMLPERLKPWAREVRDTLLRYERDFRMIALVLALGIAFQVAAVASTWMLARALGLDLPYALVAVVLPLVLVATLFPISIAGFGVREGTFVVLLDTVGISSADATLLSLFTVVALALASLPGGFALLIRGTRTAVVEGESVLEHQP
jgi:uncharacterized protein (TIRG00374 family)